MSVDSYMVEFTPEPQKAVDVHQNKAFCSTVKTLSATRVFASTDVDSNVWAMYLSALVCIDRFGQKIQRNLMIFKSVSHTFTDFDFIGRRMI